MSDTPKHTNQLINETSPYLLQHAHNPVDWYPWGEEALERARREDKPILMSIGYAACHWCHVMEHESFENEEIAAIMNEHFINIKVDREERPDLDEIYMNAVQVLTGAGGWPMTMFLTPELKPFYGGTYFPPDNRYGRPGFPRVLVGVSEAYRERREAVAKQADQITENLNRMGQMEAHGHSLTTDLLDRAYQENRSRFDARYGGFGEAPKFPPSMGLLLLLRHWRRTDNLNALEMVETTLEKMARGGMYDQLGGGFHRYSVDDRWLVPHFEKMLYDNALLTVTYLEAYQATKKPFYRQIATETLDYILREMVDAEAGGFYSTQDADSEGVEGKFFVWMPDEVEALLGMENAKIFCEYYDVTEQGNFEHKNILHVQTPQDIFAKKLRMDEQAVEAILLEGKQKLLEARERRIKPGLDDKILTSWNGLMIRSMAMGYQITGDERYREAAEKSARFILTTLSQDNGRLLRTHREGKSHLNAYLEDYAYFVAGLINLYEATFDPQWLKEAQRLNQIMIEQFWDDVNGSFFFTSKDHESLIVRSKSAYDGATPSGASMAVHNLLRLDKLLNQPDLREKAEIALQVYYHQMESAPSGSAQLLCELDFLLSTPKEIAVVGQRNSDDTQAALASIHSHFVPNKVLALASGADETDFIPLLQGKTQIDDKATIYVCENYTCKMPTTDLTKLEELL
ncbi:MAG: thioredoxin domain-containing protein [Candidatus Poribacteria bacterium]|nr:thioredoxin domain-containing protein [Candidatus Poribacteria bacterium]